MAQQSQSLRDLGSTTLKNDSDRIIHDNSELMEVFNAQKLVNRQLEAELSSLTHEHNNRIVELNDVQSELDTIKMERNKFQDILLEKLQMHGDSYNLDVLYQNEQYLRYELEKSLNSFADLQVNMEYVYLEY